jgi:hypothetical protein
MPTQSLQQHLKNAGYDLLDGPIRNHKPLQVWLKGPFSRPELYYADILHAFSSPVKLQVKKDPSLAINNEMKNDYAFKIGLTIVEELLQSIGLQPIDLAGSIESGKKLSIAYKNAMTQVVPVGDLTHFLSQADFIHPNPVLLRHANRNNLLLITGVVTAEQLTVEMQLDKKLNAKMMTALNKNAKQSIEFSGTNNKVLKMVAGNGRFPIAVKVSRLDFDKGQFSGLKLVSDQRDLF